MIVKDMKDFLQKMNDDFEVSISSFKKSKTGEYLREDSPIETMLLDKENKEVLFLSQTAEEVLEITGDKLKIKNTEEKNEQDQTN